METPLARKTGINFWFVFLVTNFIGLLFICFSIDPIFLSTNSVNPNGGDKTCVASMSNQQGQNVDLCMGRYIYIHDLPSQFNEDVLKDCHSITRITDRHDMCLFIENSGFGPRIENSNGVLSNSSSWYLTYQFILEVIFHTRMKKYECLTNDSSLASAIYVPFYSGLDLRRHLWGFSPSVRDSSGLNLVHWLVEKPEWKKLWGMDHFLASGRISRDFMREPDKNTDFGSNFRLLPESKNMSMITIESISWNDIAIPYPTSFHPSKDSEVFEWQSTVRRQNRQYLFSFVGGARPRNRNSIRGKIIDQCLASSSACKYLNCSVGSATDCDDPANVMKEFQNSVFCLQPSGDSYTRRSMFDSLLAGCIPVFFHPGSAYLQYIWYLPKNHTKYSVYVPEEKMMNNNDFRIIDTLLGVSKDEEEAMREEIIRLIPKIIYADFRSKLKTIEDAFDIAVKRILERIETIRRAIGQGRDPSIDVAETRNFSW